MKNREIYIKDPSTWALLNEGVANVNDDLMDKNDELREKALLVLRFELETFVCDGQYAKGMEHILSIYLKNIEQPQQPGVWVSGFYGSGKSHLVKMLRALWTDINFRDGATARGIANLPQEIQDHFRELSVQGKRHGRIHAASGTLGSGASGSVRLAIMRVIFRSCDLPEQYPVARFVMWLRSEGIEDEVRSYVEKSGNNWPEELDNFYVAEGLHEALVKAKPKLFSSLSACVDTLNNLYPYVKDISSSEMVKAIRQALSIDGKFPLTLVVLDEVQQYIGNDSQRSMDVQEAVEACCKSFAGKLMFIGTGQTAVTSTPNLRRLGGRFTIRIELSDADVEAVIRQVILAKNSGAIPKVEQVMEKNLGEISRQLADTTIGHQHADVQNFPQDYPVLPVRRRFWENTLRVLDPTGTESQLRNQLSMIHKAIQTNLDEPLGNVIPGDYLYFDSADRLLQARILPRKVHEKTMTWLKGSEDQHLLSRACGLVFLVNKIAGKDNEIGVKVTVDVIADLMVQDLTEGSGALRSKLPGLLDKCDLLMKVGDEYRIQTEESAAWNDEFLSQRSQLANEAHRVEAERDDRVRRKFGELVKKLSLQHGKSKVTRDVQPVFDSQLPADCAKKLCVWVRDGWGIDENSVRADARQAGNQSPTVFVFIPKRSADDLRHQLIDYKAAAATLEKRGTPIGAEGKEACAAMETAKHNAEAKINELLNEAFSGAHVFQGGGTEITGVNLQAAILEAVDNSLTRLYPQFDVADHPGWEKAFALAAKGAPDSLKAVGDTGEPENNPVCKNILGFIAGGKKGIDLRAHFESSPFGWSRDAVDGGLMALLVAGSVTAHDDHGQNIAPTALERKTIGKAFFKIVGKKVTAAQKIQIRKLMQKLNVKPNLGEELSHVQTFLDKMFDLAETAGGPAPEPEIPDQSILNEIRLLAGNEQLLALFNNQNELTDSIKEWQDKAHALEKRRPSWGVLQRLLKHAVGLTEAEVIIEQVRYIEKQRMLLAEPDQIVPLIANLTQVLRDELNELDSQYQTRNGEGMERLRQNENWKQLSPEQKNELLSEQKLTEADRPKINVQNTEEVLKTLNQITLTSFSDRIAAMKGRFDEVLEHAAALLEPEIKFIGVSGAVIKTEDDLNAWLDETKKKLLAALQEGPIAIK